MSEYEQLAQAITTLEAQRAILGDAVVETALAPLREKLTALEAQATEEQRKQVTVLFADMVGFTAMSETLDAEDVRNIMDAYFGRLTPVIVRYGGKVERLVGDAVLAIFGVPAAREDDPENGVLAALAMQQALGEFNEELEGEWDIHLAMRVGINTGLVLAGFLGGRREEDFTVVGDTVNLASRLQEAAPVGGILISRDTYRHVRGIFDVLPQEPITVKGKAEPVQTYVVQRAKPRAFRMATRGVEGIETHMVGRDAELLILQTAFQDATLQGDFVDRIKDTEPRVVTVVGDAGVGKTRLLYEFERWIESLPSQTDYFKGRATPAMVNIPYSVVRDMFAHRFDILESDRATTVLKKFRVGMGDVLDPDRADLVGHLIGFDFSASQAVQNLLGSSSFNQIATAYLTNYVRTVANQPTVIFLEDIHWADDSSLNLINHLVAEISKARLLIICLSRPLLFDRRPNWGQDDRAHTRLGLKPLSRRASRALVSEILQRVDPVPDALRDLVVERAEGNPFYVEELTKMLIDDGVILRDERGEGRWRVELDRLAEVRVPPTLTGVLQARLDSLPRAEKGVLQRASVVGRLFWNATVVELAADDADRLDRNEIPPLLDAVRGRELVFRRGRSAFEGTDEYIFKHAILRDVTYETVLLKLRRVYHAQVARWLEANARERLIEYLSLIAGHYELADERVKAVEYLRRSGKESNKVSAYQDAIAAFERALALLPEDELASRAALLVELGYAYRQASDYPLATQRLEEGLALARETGNSQTEVAVLNRLGWTMMGQGLYAEATPHLEQALALAREIGDREGIAVALYNLGDVAYRQGDGEKAERCAKESLTIFRELGDQQGIAFALRVLGFAALLREEYQETVRYHSESLTIYRKIGDRWGVATCLNNLGETVRKQHKYKEAARYYEESLPIFREIDNRMGISIGLLNLGHAHTALGEDKIAWGYLCEALKVSSAIGAVSIILEGVVGVALLQARTAQYERAAEWLGLVRAHPLFNQEIGQNADPILVTLRTALPASELEAALERGKALELEAVVAEILSDTQL